MVMKPIFNHVEMGMSNTSKLVEKAVNEISSLPGIGKKTALRLALHILKEPEIISITPKNNQLNVNTNTHISILFSKRNR